MGASAGYQAKVELMVGAALAPFTELKDASLKIDGKEIDVSTIDTIWGKSISGQKKWSMSLTCFYDPSDTTQAEALNKLVSGEDVEVAFYPFGKTSGNPKYGGKARILGTEIAAKVEDAISLPLNLVGNGILTIGTVTP